METGSWCAHRHDLYPFGSVSLSAGTDSILSDISPVFAQENPADTRPARVFGPRQVRGSTSQPMAVILDLDPRASGPQCGRAGARLLPTYEATPLDFNMVPTEATALELPLPAVASPERLSD